MLKKATFDKVFWEMASMPEYTPVGTSIISSNVNSYTLTAKDLNSNYITKYKTNFNSLFSGLTIFGTDQTASFIYSKNAKSPINFCLNGDTALTVLLSSVYIENVYNTTKLSARQRATKVLTSYLIPQLKVFSNNFTQSEIKYFGFSAVYGSKDFIDDSSKPKAELVSIVVPQILIKKYASGSITEDDLVAGSEIWLSDRDVITDIKKVKITLE
ncbi:MAG: hypothetical protein IPL10_12350 [Bacteroidetes bacterium]|nr:hypothetical protein [Bacteroidota bacterium]